ncbi:serine hydrolase domain-containing protein [Chryseobacterium jejuense]|uniref:CubicO group peptidase, beta-lactamase class C family n=1 Tax=Chryseobacterium jejuense TaxID=445960 RepID=A0A2X2VMH8_CHRJE|nr:serine hydrolase domain-containing protein [Chryseobacterium jejuense]SDJ15239.1 CubicO group peptidase, beta-lactamase class C family [Chryseobacterium jejuense]SQB28057.1 Penicillin-binding protein E [Chryseobacterium jejuense]
MKNSKIIFLLGVSLLPFKGLSQTKAIVGNVNVTKNRISLSDKLSQYMKAQADVNGFSGTVLIVRKDAVLLQEAYGLADYEWNIKNTIDTKFQLASVTKQFTAAAILQLVEKGKLSLDDKLSKFFPDYPNAESVTIHMLLSHSSGLSLGFKDLALSTLSADSAYNEIKKIPYAFSPGTKSEYSNIGYYLLGKIIEKVSGEKYAVFLGKNIFEKVGMKNTGISNNDSIILKKAKVYHHTENGLAHNPYINWKFNIGHDGAYSTVEDLALWDKALYGTTILSKKMKKRMFTSYKDQNFGYGFVINPFYNQGHQLIAHDGGFFGTMTSFNRYTDDGLFITVLSNNQSPAYMLAYGLAAICFDKEVELPYHHQKVKNNGGLYSLFTGNYDDIKILENNGKLYYNDLDTELFPESDTKFFRSDDDNRTVEFIKDSKGKYSTIKLTKAGVGEIRKKKD